jgi:hypothetical protein
MYETNHKKYKSFPLQNSVFGPHSHNHGKHIALLYTVQLGDVGRANRKIFSGTLYRLHAVAGSVEASTLPLSYLLRWQQPTCEGYRYYSPHLYLYLHLYRIQRLASRYFISISIVIPICSHTPEGYAIGPYRVINDAWQQR